MSALNARVAIHGVSFETLHIESARSRCPMQALLRRLDLKITGGDIRESRRAGSEAQQTAEVVAAADGPSTGCYLHVGMIEQQLRLPIKGASVSYARCLCRDSTRDHLP